MNQIRTDDSAAGPPPKQRRVLPKGCTITNITRGSKKGGRDHYVYADLLDQNGRLLITATLDYICKEIYISEIE